ncbi:PAS domain-containing protein [Streptomyces sp. HNM0574]|nr:PAS domain-containing protein [Streptomyces sp. HNM0574]NLU66322.1 PAS domain-containing protein [Streptomyces sp. HNM0574]
MTTWRAGPHRAPDAVAWRNRFLLLFDRVQNPLVVCRRDGTMLIANPAMGHEWGTSPGRLLGRNALELFRPRGTGQLERLTEALRLGRRSRYPLAVRWHTGGEERHGELTVEPVSDSPLDEPTLLVQLLVRRPAATGPAPQAGPGTAGPVETRILALAAAGETTSAIAGAVGLGVDGVNYHLARLADRWGVRGRTALVARAYTLGVLDPSAWPPRTAADES